VERMDERMGVGVYDAMKMSLVDWDVVDGGGDVRLYNDVHVVPCLHCIETRQ
jgi:hypothetical protein